MNFVDVSSNFASTIFYNLCRLHEWNEYVSSTPARPNDLYYKIHISNLCGLRELSEYESSNLLLEKMIYHKNHICDLYIHHELYEDVSPKHAIE